MTAERISFVIPGPPRGKGRPKFARGGAFTRVYTDAKTMAYEDQVKFYGSTAMNGRQPIEGPVVLEVVATFEIPKSMPKKRAAEATAGKVRPTTKPDADNLLKIVADGLNKIAFRDDTQVVRAVVLKIYGDTPQLLATVYPWAPA